MKIIYPGMAELLIKLHKLMRKNVKNMHKTKPAVKSFLCTFNIAILHKKVYYFNGIYAV